MLYIKMPKFKLTVTSTAQTLKQLVETALGSAWDMKQGMNSVFLQVQSKSIRYCPDGNTPTSTDGIFVSNDGVMHPIVGNVEKMQFIRAGEEDAQIVAFAGTREIP